MKIAAENGKICNKATMGEEVWFVYETDSFRLVCVNKMERRLRSTTPEMRAVLQRRTNLGFVYSY